MMRRSPSAPADLEGAGDDEEVRDPARKKSPEVRIERVRETQVDVRCGQTPIFGRLNLRTMIVVRTHSLLNDSSLRM